MDTIIITYIAYLVLSIVLTIWVAHTLFKNGTIFLDDIFHGNKPLSHSVNRLLLVGFYLLNIGYVVMNLRIIDEVGTTREMFEVLSLKLGLVILVLGVMHFFNLFVFFVLRKRAQKSVPPTFLPPQVKQA